MSGFTLNSGTKPAFGGFTAGKTGGFGANAKKFIPDPSPFAKLKTLIEQKFYPNKIQPAATTNFGGAKAKEQPQIEVKLDFDQLLN